MQPALPGEYRALRPPSSDHALQHARDILRAALAASERPARNLAETIRARLTLVGGIDLDIPAREAIRDAPDFGR